MNFLLVSLGEVVSAGYAKTSMASLSTLFCIVSETILTLIFLGTFPRGFSKSTLIKVISSSASPGLAVVPLLQLYFK